MHEVTHRRLANLKKNLNRSVVAIVGSIDERRDAFVIGNIYEVACGQAPLHLLNVATPAWVRDHIGTEHACIQMFRNNTCIEQARTWPRRGADCHLLQRALALPWTQEWTPWRQH